MKALKQNTERFCRQKGNPLTSHACWYAW